VVSVDATGTAKIAFGDGDATQGTGSGTIPSGTISVTYKTGGGSLGTIAAGTITEIGTFTDVLGNPVTLTATNSRGVDGTNPESASVIKMKAPATIRAGNRTVSREDFETAARGAAGVGRALMLTRVEEPAVDPNCGALWVVPSDLGTLTPTIRNAIAAEFARYPYAPSFILDVWQAPYLDITIKAKIYLQGSAKAAAVKAAVIANLTAWFALQINGLDNPTSNFGYYNQDADGAPLGSLAYSDLFNVVRDTQGVRKVGGRPEDFLLSSVVGSTPVQSLVHADLRIEPRWFPRFAGIAIFDGDDPADPPVPL
jgi:hypothetical protein